ncbi:MAG: zf-HC2 domain-containing protein [Acidobacteria bacterium]|jgi:hypothetical protein|nr:MAG: zf-HC2 domain-containing protein [Acidobacteriota bacterium]GIU81548.1 MAG: hypothetical protein KatS3mg006_0612 [Pyrinomonadaceae bacterium]
MEIRSNQKCPLPEIGAYVDGELSKQEETALEKHIAECPICFQELNDQKKILCVLDFAFKKNTEDLPDLTKPIIIRAESNVKGLKDKNLFYKVVLFLLFTSVCLHYLNDSILNFALILTSFFRIAYELLDGLMIGLSVILRAFFLRFPVLISLLSVFCLAFVLLLAFLKKSLNLNR